MLIAKLVNGYRETVHVVTWVSLWAALGGLVFSVLMYNSPLFTWLPTTTTHDVMTNGTISTTVNLPAGYTTAPILGTLTLVLLFTCLAGVMLGGLRKVSRVR